MIGYIALGIGLVLVIEGLVIALAPSRFEDLVRALGEIPHETRRNLGLVCVALGVGLIWVAKNAFGL